ncbi:MAG: GGDEF domain-containing protein [Anaerovibrio slackiae]|uniref:GGDEF domain-containing protein n=1 Tax=Anaerovibrio slackiae TaxID=2652309 RepID=UPI0023F31915|nr:GGDEF domain-containing protein [Anaerovibrio slackiae]MDD6163047.1 GGDEF domain-containing protein [Anaerovibrio slackiae]
MAVISLKKAMGKVFFALLAAFSLCLVWGAGGSSVHAMSLDGQWKYYDRGEIDPLLTTMTSGNANLMYDDNRWIECSLEDDFEFSPQSNGVILSTRLPKILRLNSPALFFVTRNEAVRVYLDSELLYDGQDFWRNRHVYGNRWHLVDLPDNYMGRQLTFQLYAENQKDLGRLMHVSVDEGMVQMQQIFKHDGFVYVLLPLSLIIIVILMQHYWVNDSHSCVGHPFIIAFILLCMVQAVAGMWSVLLVFDSMFFWYNAFMLSTLLLTVPLQLLACNLLEGRACSFVRGILVVSLLFFVLACADEAAEIGLAEAVRVGSYWWSNLGLVVISIFLYWQGRQEAYCRSLSWPIMATALAGIAIGVAWQYGMVDYQNGFSNLLVLPMLVYVIWLMRHMMVEEKRLSVENQLLEQEVRVEKHKAQVDPLTKSFTRAKLDETMENSVEAAEAGGVPFSLLMFDLDKFKSINDTYGHAMGDMVLVSFANIIRHNLDARHTFIRYGGEEFMVLCSQYGLEEAWQLAEQIRMDLEEAVILKDRQVTCSAGISCWHTGAGDSVQELQKRADDALYYAKNNGRNRCVLETKLLELKSLKGNLPEGKPS